MHKCEARMPTPCRNSAKAIAHANGEESRRRQRDALQMEPNCIKGFRQRDTDGHRDVLSHLTSWVHNCCQERSNKSRILPV